MEKALGAVELFCDSRVPEELRDEIRIECTVRGRSITIVERRPPWRPEAGPDWSEMKVAQLRFDEATSKWNLFCRDSSERWWDYEGIDATPTVDPLLAEIAADPTGIFWG